MYTWLQPFCCCCFKYFIRTSQQPIKDQLAYTIKKKLYYLYADVFQFLNTMSNMVFPSRTYFG